MKQPLDEKEKRESFDKLSKDLSNFQVSKTDIPKFKQNKINKVLLKSKKRR